jgi:sulfonate transport system permease protein
MRLGFGYSWRALIGAELLAAAAGLGYMIIEAEELARPDIVLVGIITIGILGHLIDALFMTLSRKLIPWQDMENSLERS